GPYSQESFQFVNGTTSRSATISWRLRPLAVGTARVHSIVVQVGKQVAELTDLEVEVQQEPVESEEPQPSRDPFDRIFDPFGTRPGGRAARPRGDVFLRAEVTPDRAYVGQQVLYTLYLYTQSDISSINPENLPEFQGFWVREIPQPKHYQPEMVEVDGKRFARVRLLERALFPLRAGSFELEATRALMAVRVPVTSMRLSLLSQTEEIQRVSNTVSLTVEPLPDPPPGFSGAVGELSLSAELRPETLQVGEAATLELVLGGRGLLQGLPDPELPRLASVEVYPPQQRSTDEVRDGDVYGERRWSYVLVPERPGSLDIPPIDLPYFDPASARYRVASTEPLRLEVVPSTRVARAAGGEPSIHGIRSAAVPIGGSASMWWRRAPHGLMLAALLGLVVVWATRRSDRFTPEHREAVHRMEDRLESLAALDRPRQVAAELEAAWRDYLEHRWEVAPGVAANRWHDELTQRGANERASRDLERLVHDLHYLRYAPQLSSTEALQSELVQRSRQILRSLH
ncbi:MAG: BatD family protein, partial [Thermoanaerobaculia bacterium]|nr:BatD family protein [Thermoanaerobaculia bacterium]